MPHLRPSATPFAARSSNLLRCRPTLQPVARADAPGSSAWHVPLPARNGAGPTSRRFDHRTAPCRMVFAQRRHTLVHKKGSCFAFATLLENICAMVNGIAKYVVLQTWFTGALEKAQLFRSFMWECVHVTENGIPVMDNAVLVANIVKQMRKLGAVVAFNPIAAIILLVIFF